MRHFSRTTLSSLAILALLAAPALATPISFTATGTGPDGAALAAQADFSISGTTLTIELSNIAEDDDTSSGMDVPGSTLTGVFFDFAKNPAMTPVSAFASSIYQPEKCDVENCSETTNVGGEFYFGTGISLAPGYYGIASAGYVGGAGNFNGLNLDDPEAVDGINFGIISYDDFHPNGGMGGLVNEPLIRDRVWLTLTLPEPLGEGASLDDLISNVSFQYGTALTETNIPGRHDVPMPEPGVLTLLGLGLGALGLYRRRAARR